MYCFYVFSFILLKATVKHKHLKTVSNHSRGLSVYVCVCLYWDLLALVTQRNIISGALWEREDPSPSFKNIWEIRTVFITALNQLPSWYWKTWESPGLYACLDKQNTQFSLPSLQTEIPEAWRLAVVAKNNKHVSPRAVAETHLFIDTQALHVYAVVLGLYKMTGPDFALVCETQ